MFACVWLCLGRMKNVYVCLILTCFQKFVFGFNFAANTTGTEIEGGIECEKLSFLVLKVFQVVVVFVKETNAKSINPIIRST